MAFVDQFRSFVRKPAQVFSFISERRTLYELSLRETEALLLCETGPIDG